MAEKCIVEASERLLVELNKVDWGEYLDYGYVKVRVEKGQASMLTVEQTFKF